MNIFITEKNGEYEISTSIDLDCQIEKEVVFAREILSTKTYDRENGLEMPKYAKGGIVISDEPMQYVPEPNEIIIPIKAAVIK